MKVYREENICKNPSPTGKPFFDIDLLNKLSKEGWNLKYVLHDDRFLVAHTTIKALFVKDVLDGE